MFIAVIEKRKESPKAIFLFKNEIDAVTFFFETDFQYENDIFSKDDYVVKFLSFKEQRLNEIIRELQAVFYSSKLGMLDYLVSYYSVIVIDSSFCDKIIEWRKLTRQSNHIASSKNEIQFTMKIDYEQFLKIMKGEEQCHQK